MKNRIIVTMTDEPYFKYGKYFLETLHRANASAVYCFGHDLSAESISMLCKHGVFHIPVGDEYVTRMQTLKFKFMRTILDMTGNQHHGIVTFCDFDTWFNRPWWDALRDDPFTFGITYRSEMIAQNKRWAASNGGVFFVRNTMFVRNLLDFATEVIENGGSRYLPEYDAIFRTLEEGRSPKKTQSRKDLSWNCDQVFLSAVLEHLGYNPGRYRFVNVRPFPCDQFNRLDTMPYDLFPKDIYIGHLKKAGRDKI
jgi:hypothetical protein